MFAKLLLMSFIYKLTETFYFPNKKAIEIYNKYNIERAFLYHVLTDTNSTCIMFLIICNAENNIPTKNFANYFLKLTLPTKFTTGLIPLTLTRKFLMRENCSCKSVWDTLKLKVQIICTKLLLLQTLKSTMSILRISDVMKKIKLKKKVPLA